MASLGRSRDGKSSILEKPLSRGKSEVIIAAQHLKSTGSKEF